MKFNGLRLGSTQSKPPTRPTIRTTVASHACVCGVLELVCVSIPLQNCPVNLEIPKMYANFFYINTTYISFIWDSCKCPSIHNTLKFPSQIRMAFILVIENSC